MNVRSQCRIGWNEGTHTVSDGMGWSGEMRTSEMS